MFGLRKLNKRDSMLLEALDEFELERADWEQIKNSKFFDVILSLIEKQVEYNKELLLTEKPENLTKAIGAIWGMRTIASLLREVE